MNLIFGILMILTLTKVGTAQAIELMSYKDTNTGIVSYSVDAVEKAWNSNQQAACLKDGGKILGVNKVFKSKGLKYNDCSTSENRRKIHRALGFNVTVFKLSELPASMIKDIKGVK